MSLKDYTVQRRLGVGGMAETLLATRRGPGGVQQRVCLKRVLPAYAQDERFTGPFLDEARLCAHMRHANIVQVLDFGEENGTHYLALELIEGVDLRKLLKHVGGPLPESWVRKLAFELACALEYCHELEVDGVAQHVVHRDISPSNVLLSKSGEVKLADFGIAKADLRDSVTSNNAVKGKVAYMSPEQARGQSLDARSDLFSLGVVLYEALSGRRPFQGATEMATMMLIATGERDKLADAAPNASPEFVGVVERLLHSDPVRRFSSAEALSDALGSLRAAPGTRKALARAVSDAENAEALRRSEPGSAIPGKALGGGASIPGTTPDQTQQDPAFAPTERSDAPTAVSSPPSMTMRVSNTPAEPLKPPKVSTLAPDEERVSKSAKTDQPQAAEAAGTPRHGTEPLKRSNPPLSLERQDGQRPQAVKSPWPLRIGLGLLVVLLAGGAWALGRMGATPTSDPIAELSRSPAVEPLAEVPSPPPIPMGADPGSPADPSEPELAADPAGQADPPTPGEPVETDDPRPSSLADDNTNSDADPTSVAEPEPVSVGSSSSEMTPRIGRRRPTMHAPTRPNTAMSPSAMDPSSVMRPSAPTTTPPAMTPAESAVMAPVAPRPAAMEASSEMTSPLAAMPGPTRIIVQVSPHGMVWVDGRRRGPAPVTLRVSPGQHTVAVGRESPDQSRPVDVREGQTRRMSFTLR